MKTIKNKSEYTWYEKCVLNITSLRRMFKVRKDQMSQLCELCDCDMYGEEYTDIIYELEERWTELEKVSNMMVETLKETIDMEKKWQKM